MGLQGCLLINGYTGMTSFTETKDGERKFIRKFRQIIRVLVLDRVERVRRV